MKRYAFIDVLNTANSAEKMLGFAVDWARLAEYLINKRSCTEVFFYTGIENGDTETAQEFDSLSKIDCCVVRSKPVFAYKNKDKTVAKACRSCGEENVFTVDMGYNKKSNCDVELGVDTIEKSAHEVELMIFTGDGDFEYLIRRALEKGVEKVYVFSYAGKEIRAGVTISRFSTKLRDLIAEKRERVFYTSLNDIKHAIKKDISIT
ncbi:MAG: NYN domain-containing protein [Patescibacteria group bacterium]